MPYVYIFQSGDTNYFKIGRTRSDVEQRRRELSTGNPHPLKLVDCIETDHDALVEKYLHTKFNQYLSKGSDATEYFEIEPNILSKGLAEARAFLAEYIPLHEQTEAFKDTETTGEVKVPNDEVIALYKQLLLLKGQIDGLQFERDVLENRIKSKIGDADGIEGVATWKTQVRMALDQAALKAQHPAIVEAFSKQQRSRVFKLL